MRQYDVFRNPTPRSRKAMPYLVVLQHDVVSDTDSVMVAALAPVPMRPPSRLYPEVEVRGRTYTLLTPDLASLPRAALKEPVADLRQEWHRIVAALDILFSGI
jgi:toxin CcdB